MNWKKRSLSEVVGLDFGAKEVKAVRLKRTDQSLSLEGVDVIPFDFSSDKQLRLPRHLCPNYAALTCSGERDVVRVVSKALARDAEGVDEAALRDSLSVDDSFRVASRIIVRGRGKEESSILGVAVPEGDVQQMLRHFETGAPASISIEVSFLSALNSYLLLQPEVAET